MTDFVLVHGAWHGGWCWDKVVTLLKNAGHNALAPDLPAHGASSEAIDGITLAAYVESIVAVINKNARPVVLVGHSMGGAVISGVAEKIPEKISSLVFLCAMASPDGKSLLELGEAAAGSSELAKNSVLAENGLSITIKENALRSIFYGQCSDEDVANATSKLGPESVVVVSENQVLTADRFGSISKVYIECAQDNALSLAQQSEMAASINCDVIHRMDTDHSPFLSAPEALTEILLTTAVN